MIASSTFRKKVLEFEQVSEAPHFNKTSFRIRGKIFASLDSEKNIASLKLDETDQSVYCLIRPVFAVPATGAWGKQGWTLIDLKKMPAAILTEALGKAYGNVAPQKKTKTVALKKTDGFIQTLHPDQNKTNKRISLEKYKQIKEALLSILQKKTLTHTELMESLYQKVKDRFAGGVQWYGETVKLDLEARKIIERTGTKPDKYRLNARK